MFRWWRARRARRQEYLQWHRQMVLESWRQDYQDPMTGEETRANILAELENDEERRYVQTPSKQLKAQ